MTDNYPKITEDNKDYVVSIMMMDLVDVFASNLPKNVDPRAWEHLLAYCPAEQLISRLKIVKENSIYSTQLELSM